MALPSLAKTWQFTVNQTIASAVAATANANLLIGIKNALKGFGTNPWTVISSASRTGTFGAADNWGAAADVVWATTGNRSWIVLQNAAGVQILIYTPLTTSTDALGLKMSNAVGFTGGNATTLPSASDEHDVASGLIWAWGGNLVTSGHRYHVMMSTDGESTRVFVARGGFCVGTWWIEKVRSPVSGFTAPWVACVLGTNSSAANHANGASTGLLSGATGTLPAQLRYRHAGQNNVCALTTDAYGSTIVFPFQAQAVVSDWDSNWPFGEVGLFGLGNGARGRLGAGVHDVWCSSLTTVSGDTYPGDSSHQFVQMAGLIYPWNGTAPGMS